VKNSVKEPLPNPFWINAGFSGRKCKANFADCIASAAYRPENQRHSTGKAWENHERFSSAEVPWRYFALSLSCRVGCCYTINLAKRDVQKKSVRVGMFQEL
jgi:hypothetical protein